MKHETEIIVNDIDVAVEIDYEIIDFGVDYRNDRIRINNIKLIDTFIDFLTITAGDGTLDEYEAIQKAIEKGIDNSGCLFKKAELLINEETDCFIDNINIG